jgi:hypothetical protein
MKRTLLALFSAVTIVGGYASLQTASAQTEPAPPPDCTPPRGAENCTMLYCTCSNGWCTSEWRCPH